jgi:hypothetical protein
MTQTTLTDTARELHLYMVNCADAWRQAEYTFRNYERKRAKGTYDPYKARAGLRYAVEAAAKLYARDHCDALTHWYDVFPAAARREVADVIMTDAEHEWSVGNFWSIAA